ncbi:stage V sporulation protein AB [Alkalibacillus haloalkaliphilus]|uniref:stage V sporulation protein AB n=1 Tax=Alkalibacillus haloalkaliphilus TaxID=94136 RepID=UPI00293643EE|nr:stage V sporulation protein AB [Alkalibacillus haloalkaliphilus]MDV2580876.1 stage V sporulation protein AB [Alkalibacillus haloalkaliphilus]
MISYAVEIIVGLSAGLAVGSGFVAFLTVLGIIPRLVQLSKSGKLIRVYEWSVILGAMFGIWITFSDYTFQTPIVVEMYWGLLHGIFVGMLAAALTEVLNVFPILAKRLQVDNFIPLLVLAIVLGKILGSLFQWIFFVN